MTVDALRDAIQAAAIAGEYLTAFRLAARKRCVLCGNVHPAELSETEIRIWCCGRAACAKTWLEWNAPLRVSLVQYMNETDEQFACPSSALGPSDVWEELWRESND